MWVEIFKVVRHYVFEKLQSDYDLDAAALATHFRQRGGFSEDNVALLQRGFASYFSGDYMSALHVLIPRVESMVRDILEHANLPVADPASGGAFTLGTLFSNEGFRGAAGTNLIAYYEYVLLKPGTGLNLRNSVSHGTLEMDRMDRGNTELILHLLLTLTRFYRYPLESEEAQDA